jgi:hypothetical protein
MLMIRVSTAVIFGVIVVAWFERVSVVVVTGINFKSLEKLTNSLIKLHMFRGGALFFVPHFAPNLL